jgi:hypothetical protein
VAEEERLVQPGLFPVAENTGQGTLNRATETARLPKARTYRRVLNDGRQEWLAGQVYAIVRALSGPGRGLSRVNARCLVDTYGTRAVGKALGRMQWLAERDRVTNPAGFMLTVSRQQWRVLNQATEAGDTAPVFRAQVPRKLRQKKYDPVTQSERWLVWRIGMAREQWDAEAMALWREQLEALVEKQSVKRLRWRLRFAQTHEAQEAVTFWERVLAWKLGRVANGAGDLYDVLTVSVLPF